MFGFVDSVMTASNLYLLSESPGHFDTLRDLAPAARLSGPRIHVARIAALCLHHGVRELSTADRDFSTFPQLKTRNPLVRIWVILQLSTHWGSKPGIDATKKLPGERFKRPWRPIIHMNTGVKAKAEKRCHPWRIRLNVAGAGALPRLTAIAKN